LIYDRDSDQKSGKDIKGLHRKHAAERNGVGKAADMCPNYCESQQKTDKSQKSNLPHGAKNYACTKSLAFFEMARS